jgi:hypothetical protein
MGLRPEKEPCVDSLEFSPWDAGGIWKEIQLWGLQELSASV